MQTLSGCPICESPRAAFFYEGRTARNPVDPARWRVWRCPDCDLLFLNPQPSWDDLEPYYNAEYQSYDPSCGLADEFELVVQRARETGEYRHVSIRPGMRILDVGCGGGSFLRVATRLGATAEGVEPSPIAAQRVRDAGQQVYTGTLEQFADQHSGVRQFDLVTFNHVVEHLPDPIRTLAVARSLLRQGGRIWMAVPNGASRACRTLRWRWHSTDLPFHLMLFSPESVRIAARRAGLTVERLYTLSLPGGVRSTLTLLFRHKALVPRRLADRLISDSRVARIAARDDQAHRGEAILAELDALIAA